MSAVSQILDLSRKVDQSGIETSLLGSGIENQWIERSNTASSKEDVMRRQQEIKQMGGVRHVADVAQNKLLLTTGCAGVNKVNNEGMHLLKVEPSNKKLFECTICFKQFGAHYNLTRHMPVHTGMGCSSHLQCYLYLM